MAAEKGAWWLDKSFGKIDISAAAKVGANQVKIEAAPMTMLHELESAYLLGQFSLKPGASGFAIVPPRPLRIGRDGSGAVWNEQGLPFF